MADNPTGSEGAPVIDANTTKETEGSTPPEGVTAPASPDNKTVFDLDYVKGLRSESAGYRTKLRDVETERDTFATKATELEATVTPLNERVAAAESTALKYEVALEKGLPLSLAKRLSGADRDELAADADALLEAVGKSKPVTDMGQGTRHAVNAPKPTMTEALRVLALGE